MRIRRTLAAVLATALGAGLLAGDPQAIAAELPEPGPGPDAFALELVSGSADGIVSADPTISDDGRHVAWWTRPETPGPGAPPPTVHLLDAAADTEVDSILGTTPALSGDGATLAYASLGGPVETVPVATAGTATPAAVPLPDGAAPGGFVGAPVLDDDGDVVVYAHQSDFGEPWEIVAATGGAAVVVGDAGDALFVDRPAVSADGDRVAWIRLDPVDGWVATLHDRSAGTTDDVAVVRAIADSPAESFGGLSLSDDGTLLAVVASGDDDGRVVQVVDVADPSAPTASTLPPYLVADFGNALAPSMSDDGTAVAFAAFPPGSADAQVWFHDVSTGVTSLVTRTDADAAAAGMSTAVLSGDGRALAVTSTATDLVPGGATGLGDVYLANRAGDAAPEWPDAAALVATTTTSHSIEVAWPAALAAAADGQPPSSYLVRLDGAPVATVAADAARTFVAEDLEPDTAYDLAVVAVTAGGGTSVPLELTTSTTEFTKVPLSVAVEDTTVTLSWPASERGDVTGYRVVRSDVVDDSDSAVIDLLADDLEFVDSGRPEGRSYAYEVQTLHAGGVVRPHTVTVPVTTGVHLVELEAYQVPDGVQLAWSGGSIADTFIVRRAVDGGDFEEIATLVGQLSHIDEDVEPDTTYTYVVDKVIAGTPQTFTTEATITTEPVQVSSTSWSAPVVTTDMVRSGADLAIVVVGTPEQTATAVIDLLRRPAGGGEPEADTETVDLTEDPTVPGRYTGTFLLAPGITEITGITGAIGDAEAAATGLPVGLSASIALTLVGPPEARAGGQIVRSATGLSATVPVTDAATYDLAGVIPGTLQNVSIYDSSWRRTAQLEVADLLAGERRELTVTPARFVDVPVTVLTADGAPVPDARIGIEAGELYAAGTAGPDGVATLRNAPAGVPATVHVGAPFRFALPYGDRAAQDVTVDPDAPQPIVVHLPELPRATVSGVVTRLTAGGDEVPVAGATVRVTQDVQYRTFEFATTTGLDGTYAVEALQGDDAVVTGQAPGDRMDREEGVDIGPGGAVQDLQLVDVRTYRVTPTLETDYLDGPTTGVPIDGPNGYHYYLNLRSPDQSVVVGTPEVRIQARPGDTVQFCADGFEVGLPRACATAVAPEDGDSFAVGLTLTEPGRLAGTIGIPSGGSWEALLGTPAGGRRYIGVGPNVAVPFAEPGRHYLTVHSGAISVTRVVDVEAGDLGEILDLGALDGAGSTGPFSSSSVRVLTDEAVPGDVASLRAEVARSGAGTVDLQLAVPAGTSFVDGSVTVDGQPVEVDDAGAPTVALGSPSSSAPPIVRWQVRLDDDVASGSELPVVVTATLDGGDPQPLPSGGAIHVRGLTLVAPAITAERDVELSGRAPAGAHVQVRTADGEVLGEVPAHGRGYWRLATTLPDRGPLATHLLRAEVVGDDGVPPALATVRFDPTEPMPTEVAIEQAGARRVAWDPREGPARFPFVFVPGVPIDVDLRFTNPDRVTDAVAIIGEFSAEAVRQPDGSFRASVPSDGRGEISFGYDVIPAPLGLADVPELTSAEVAALSNGPLDGVVLDEESVTSDDDSVGFAVELPQLDDGVTAAVETTLLVDQPYEPTAEDLANEAATGAAVYDVRTELVEEEDGSLVLTLGARFPTGAPAAAGLLAKAGIPGLASSTAAEIRMEINKFGFDLHAIDNALSSGQKYESISDLLGLLGPCDDAAVQEYEDRIDQIMDETIRSDFASFLAGNLVGQVKDLAIGVLAASPNPPGLGVQLLAEFSSWGAGVVLDQFNGNVLDLKVSGTADLINNDSRCQNDGLTPEVRELQHQRRNRMWDGAGAPGFAIDPSGYVYEAVESNRIPGVVATARYRETPAGGFSGDEANPADSWQTWDADWWGQANPLETDANGRYAWDVPEGWWQVAFTADGYEPAFSPALEVLPPRFDVNVGMVSLAAPTVTSVTGVAGPPFAVDVTFDRYMQPETVASALGVAGVPGTVAPLDAEDDPDGRSLARTFRFTPATAPAGGQVLTLTVGTGARSYAERPLAAPSVHQVTVPAAPTPPGGTGGGGGGGTPTAPGTGEVDVEVPGGGTATVRRVAVDDLDDDYQALGEGYEIDAPGATVDDPLRLTFRVPAADVDPGQVLVVLRDGVRAAPACDAPDRADPDPCVASITGVGDDVEVVVLSSHASTWVLALPAPGAIGAACGGDDDQPFGDVPATNSHADAIACLAAAGIARGRTASSFDPLGGVSRAQMASFLVRMLEEAGVDLPAPAAAFADVAGPHADAIGRLAALGVARGVSADRFDPSGVVSRAQMASFLVRVVEAVEGEAVPAAGDAYGDDDGSAHEGAIDRISALGIALGVGDGRFAPGDPVRRDQMASFLARTLNRWVLLGEA